MPTIDKNIEEKIISKGQGMVGQCALEKQTMYLTNVPDKYVNITSGLGEATPTHLVLVPLLANEACYGVIEMASFQKIEPYQLNFLEKVAESIATTLNAVKLTLQTQQLLGNTGETDSRSHKDVLRHQLDSIIAMQNRMQEDQAENESLFAAIDSNLLTAIFTLNGDVLTANDKLTTLCNLSLEKLRHHGFLVLNNEHHLWQDLMQGNTRSGDFKVINHQGVETWINASFTPMQALKGQQPKVLMLGTDITEKKLVLEKLSLVANNTDNSVVITDSQGCIEYVNAGFTKMTGYQPQEVMGKKPGHFLQGERTNPNTVARIREKLKSGVSFYEEILNYRKDGQAYWISLMINPVKNGEGETEKFISIQANVSQIKETTLEYTLKLEAIGRSNAIIEFDMQGNIVDVNPIFLSVAGYEKEALLGKPYTCLLPEAERSKPQVEMMWDNLKKGTFFSGEFIQQDKDGKAMWLNGTFNPIPDMEGKLQRILMFAQFTTHEKAKQNELSSMFEAVNNSVLTLEMDTKGALKKANALFLKIFGYKRSAIARKTIVEVTKDTSEVAAILARLPEENLISTSLTWVTSEGKELTYQATFNAIRDLEQQVYRIVIILTENPVSTTNLS